MDPKTSLPSAAFLIEMINIDYKWFLWLCRCEHTWTPNGSSSGNMWTTSSISSCQELSSRCTRWCESRETRDFHCTFVCVSQKNCELCSCSWLFPGYFHQDSVPRCCEALALARQSETYPLNLFHLISPAWITSFSGLLPTSEELLFVTLLKSCLNYKTPEFEMQMRL